MARLIAVYDACVLYPAPLRDTLMHIGLADLCQPRWTEQIQEEWSRNLLANRSDLARAQIERVHLKMNAALPDAVITGYEHLIEGLTLPDPDDRHVLAAAIHAEAQMIVTNNQRDFPSSTLREYDLESCSADAFLTRIFEKRPLEVVAALHKQRQGLKKPPKTSEEFLDTLKQQGLTLFVQNLRPHITLL